MLLEINLFVAAVCAQKANKNDVSQRGLLVVLDGSQTALAPIHLSLHLAQGQDSRLTLA